ncbi:nucleotide exchange factor GrpE [Psychroserpens damuponensis]|uniref:nucleotide exchange factor GrpE n=1 Tax=Psychroserpens damuponensis TaxID=943936 RepID=UPI00058BDC41|nr:nucleotide exchange factor GrpE [Psychroserpens damuponensis]
MGKKDKNQTIDEPQVQEDINETNTETQVEELTVEEQLREDLAKEKDKFMRLFAEFENYKKRTTKERIDLFTTASEEVIVSLLPVLDDFERALMHIEEDKEAEELRKGVLLIYNKLVSTLEKKGLAKIEVSQGDAFNADDHEAITQIPAPTDDLKGKIIDVIEKGYKLGEKVIRFPKVVIGQ